MKVTITRIVRRDKNREGQPYTTKDGRPYSLVSLQTREHGAQWLGGFSNYTNDRWNEGDEVEIEVEKKVWNGKEQLNFASPSPMKKLEVALDALTRRVEFLEAVNKGRTQATAPRQPEPDFLESLQPRDYEQAGFMPDEPSMEDQPPF